MELLSSATTVYLTLPAGPCVVDLERFTADAVRAIRPGQTVEADIGDLDRLTTAIVGSLIRIARVADSVVLRGASIHHYRRLHRMKLHERFVFAIDSAEGVVECGQFAETRQPVPVA